MPADSTGLGLAAYVTEEMMVFAAVCVIAAALIIILDWVLLATQDRSFLDISYGERNRFAVLLAWAVAAGIVGLISAAAQILQPNIQGALAVAVGWPMILSNLLESSRAVVQTSTPEEVEE